MKKLQFIDIGKPFRIIGKICKDIERAFRFKGINVNFIVMMIDYIGFAFILKWNLQVKPYLFVKESNRGGPINSLNLSSLFSLMLKCLRAY